MLRCPRVCECQRQRKRWLQPLSSCRRSAALLHEHDPPLASGNAQVIAHARFSMSASAVVPAAPRGPEGSRRQRMHSAPPAGGATGLKPGSVSGRSFAGQCMG